MNNEPRFGMIRSGDTIQMTIYETYERIKEQLRYTRDAGLDGVPIRVTHAAEKYNVPAATLHRWSKKGILRIIREGPKLLELDEADVKWATQVYHKATEYMPNRKASWVLKRVWTNNQQTGE